MRTNFNINVRSSVFFYNVSAYVRLLFMAQEHNAVRQYCTRAKTYSITMICMRPNQVHTLKPKAFQASLKMTVIDNDIK